MPLDSSLDNTAEARKRILPTYLSEKKIKLYPETGTAGWTLRHLLIISWTWTRNCDTQSYREKEKSWRRKAQRENLECNELNSKWSTEKTFMLGMYGWEAEVKQNLKWYSLPLLQGTEYLQRNKNMPYKKQEKVSYSKSKGKKKQIPAIKN